MGEGWLGARALPPSFPQPSHQHASQQRDEAEEAFKTWNPLIWQFIKARGLFAADPVDEMLDPPLPRRRSLWERLMVVFRRDVVDRFGRRIISTRK